MPISISSVIPKGGVEEEGGKTHGGEPFLLSDDGNRKTNFAGCVKEQFEITNVTGTLHDLDT